MIGRRIVLTLAAIVACTGTRAGSSASLWASAPAAPPSSGYAIHPVPSTAVRLTDEFWRPRLEINRTVTIPHIMRENETTGRVANFLKAAHAVPGAYHLMAVIKRSAGMLIRLGCDRSLLRRGRPVKVAAR